MNRSWALVAVLPLLVSPLLAQKDSASSALLQQVRTRLSQDQAVKSVVAAGTVTDLRSGAAQSFQFRALGADRIRWDSVNDEGHPVKTVVVRNSGWIEVSGEFVRSLSVREVVGQGLELLPLIAIDHWLESADFEIDALVSDPATAPAASSISLRQRVTDSKSVAEGIRATLTTRRLVVDSLAQLPVAIRYQEALGDWRNRVEGEFEYSDFTEAAGFFVPMTITRTRQGQGLYRYVLDSVVFNAEVDETLFERGR